MVVVGGGGWWWWVVGVELEGVGGKKFTTYCRGGVGGGGQLLLAYFLGGVIFFNALFCKLFFRESDITCIITIVGAQQQHKGIIFKTWGGGGAKIFQQCHGGRAIFFPRIREGGWALFFSTIDFCRTTTPPPPPPGHK